MWTTYLRDPRATGVRGKHLDQNNRQESKGQSPVGVHEVVHNVGARTLKHTKIYIRFIEKGEINK